MADAVTIDLRHVARGLNIPLRQVQAVVELLDDGNTVPFITRYRRDRTGGLDEEQIRKVRSRLEKLRLLADRKQTILRSIEAQGKLSEDLASQIHGAGTTKRLEDLYLPYKPRKQTLATVARSRGLEPLAQEILAADPACADLDARAADFVSTEREVPSAADALLGAGHILAEEFSEHVEVRQRLREIFARTGKFVSSRIGDTGSGRSEPQADGDANDKPAEPTPAADQPESKPPETPEATTSDTAATTSDAASPPPSETQPKPTGPGQQPGKPSLKEIKKKKAHEQRIKAFQDYFDYSEDLRKIPPHRILAINRGARAKVLRVRIESDTAAMHDVLDNLLVPPEHPYADYLRGCARDALNRLLLPSLEREIRRELTDEADTHAVGVFAQNLRNLFLQPPVRDRRVLAVDPGFRSGCKLAALDQFGNMLEKGIIYLVGKPQQRANGKQRVVDLINRYQLTVVVIGNGTACRQTEDFISELINGELKDRGLSYVIVNEAGASVYSTSRIAREELPHYDASLRGAISIGRRLQDPLSELVKIDPANIGVGMYQHDVKAKHLQTSLDEVVESCVNYVGVDVNTASPALLRYVSGLNQLTARRLYEYRRGHGPLRNRRQLCDVPGFGEATFVQAAGFLKITAGDNPLDATWIHPESYDAATDVLEKLGFTMADLADKEKAAAMAECAGKVDVEATAQELGIGKLLLRDILSQLVRPGRDPREDLPAPIFRKGVLTLDDLSPDMELTGTVLNVVDFGCFIDIGLHHSGLVHVSQMADEFVGDVHKVVAVGDIVRVWVLRVDKDRHRVSLTMIKPGTPRQHRRQRGRRGEKGEQSEQGERPDGGKAPEKTAGAPRGKRPAKDRHARSAKHKRPSQHRVPPKPKRYKPKSRPKPVVPITDAMKAGAEPLRTFGDLLQFYQQQEESDDSGEKSDPAEANRDSASSTPDEATDANE